MITRDSPIEMIKHHSYREQTLEKSGTFKMKYLENYNIVIPRQFHHDTSLKIFTSTKKLHCLKQMGLLLKKCLVSKSSLKTVLQVN